MIQCKTLLNNPIINEYQDLQAKSQSLIVETLSLYHSVASISYYDIHGALRIIRNSLKIQQKLTHLQQILKATNIANFMLKESLRKAEKTHYVDFQEINIIATEITKDIDMAAKYKGYISSMLFKNNIVGLIINPVEMMKLFVVDTSTCIIESRGFLSADTFKDYY